MFFIRLLWFCFLFCSSFVHASSLQQGLMLNHDSCISARTKNMLHDFAWFDIQNQEEQDSTGLLVANSPEASFVAPALIWVVGGTGGTILGGPIVAPVVGVIYTGITIARIIKHNQEKNNAGGGAGSDGEDKDKKKDKDKKQKIDAENKIKAANKQIENSLPSGFKGTRDKQGNYARNKQGHLVDNKGNTWRWNAKTERFDVFNKNQTFVGAANSVQSAVSPQLALQMKAGNLAQPEKQGCGDWQKPQEPVALKSPAADQTDRPIHTGGSVQKVETATNTAHDAVSQVTPKNTGCGGFFETPDQQAARMALRVKPPKISKLDGYAKKELTPGQIKEIEDFNKAHPHGKYQESNKHHVNSRENISKPPRNGQDALDNSFIVKGSKQRIAVQDNNVVILQPSLQGEYHGYIHNDLNSLEQKYKETLVENGFLKDAKSRKLMK